jgi:hypothetical protein
MNDADSARLFVHVTAQRFRWVLAGDGRALGGGCVATAEEIRLQQVVAGVMEVVFFFEYPHLPPAALPHAPEWRLATPAEASAAAGIFSALAA